MIFQFLELRAEKIDIESVADPSFFSMDPASEHIKLTLKIVIFEILNCIRFLISISDPILQNSLLLLASGHNH